MRQQLLLSLALVVVAMLGWLVGWHLGDGAGLAFAVVLLAPLVAVALAPLAVPLLGVSVRAVRAMAYRDVQGRHFAYKGHPFTIQEDLTGNRWVRVRDIRGVVPDFPRDRVLMRIAPDAIARPEGERELYFQANSLDRYLARSHTDATIRFRNWLQREVLFPAERASRLGATRTVVRQAPPTAAP